MILIHVISPCPRKGAFGLNSLSSFFRKQQLEHTHVTSNTPTEGGSGSIIGNGGIFGGGVVGIFGGNGVMDGSGGGKDADFLKVMKRACQKAHPDMKVRVEKVEQGCMDKANTVLSHTKKLAIDLLIIGQRRNLSNILLG